ncbi:MAG TPA: prepilin-type N-terminal cleavage/methylation domain-containing protein [Armatimonadota bacterium]
MIKFRSIPSKSGFTLIEVMLVVMMLVLTALIFAAVFPTAQISRVKAANTTFAANLAQQMMEEKMSGGYGSCMPCTVTSAIGQLVNGSQTTTITQFSTNVRKIQIQITWGGYRQVGGNVKLVTFLSNHS